MTTADTRRTEAGAFLVVESLTEDDLSQLHVWLLANLKRSDLSTDGPAHIALRIALEQVRRERSRRGQQLRLG